MRKIKLWWTSAGDLLNWLIRLGIFVLLIVTAVQIYRYLLSNIIDGRLRVTTFVLFWLFSAYIVLPRIHRRLTKLYLPSYFIGRVRTSDGLLGDPVNMAIIGSGRQLVDAMEKAGWTLADDLSLKSSVKMTLSSIRRKSYRSAPVSSLYLFSEKQSYAFQMEINGNPRARHHVRFWRTPRDWWLPGGYRADWLGAATFDKHVGFSLFTGQITHKIDSDIDKERDFVCKSLKSAKAVKKVEVVEHFSSGFHDRNGGGDRIHTDGALPFVNLK
jgi:hypothetical protein